MEEHGPLLTGILAWIDNSAIAATIRESSVAFPWLECIHVAAIALVFGVISIVDLRLLGIAGHGYRTPRLLRTLLPLTWAAFAVALVTGALMFTSQPGRYLATPAFLLKMGLLLVAGVNMAVFHVWSHRSIHLWDEHGIPAAAKLAGLSSLVLWVAIVFAGRFIGFTLAFG